MRVIWQSNSSLIHDSQRVAWVDITKAYGIIAVVLGHMVTTGLLK
ncbi:hypothetical protein HMPREF9104_00098 [Lentilactobacillus kisonensis F0435]|uniref:Acyltransferase 3 domain-containing protein n=2 Tax=Lentilactobacillus kisonensis TaxID=481722 RepID=H1LBY7_9LACO|nr:hypothetical protein HMPREF9104_00098 [Lentilactobacillus kisonensis F0435]